MGRQAFLYLFFGFLRSGEVMVPIDGGYDPSTHLSFGDVRLGDAREPQFLEVTIKASHSIKELNLPGLNRCGSLPSCSSAQLRDSEGSG